MDNRERAAYWFAAQRRGMMTIEERAAYAAWLEVPENAALMAQMDAAWAGLAPLKEHFAPARRRPAKLSRMAMVAVVCIASLGLGLLSSTGGNNDFWTTLDWSSR